MSNEIDRANEYAAFANEVSLKNFLQSQSAKKQRIIDAVVMCEDCENEIPTERLTVLPHCTRCIDCQIAYEKELKL